MKERRDYSRRAEAMRRVIRHLLDSNGLGSDEVRMASAPGATERIVKRLALRGLVKRAADRWIPSPVLGHAVTLHACEPAV